MHTRSFWRDLRPSSLLLAATAAGLAAVPSISLAAMDRPATTAAEALQRLSQNASGAVTENRIAGSAYATVHASAKRVLMVDNAADAPLARAQNFLSIYGSVLGVKNPLAELRQKRVSTDGNGGTHVHLDQYYQGLPVFGARVVVHMNAKGITGTNGVFIEGLDGLSISPQLSVGTLRARGLAATRKLHPKSALTVESSRLMIYRTGLLKGIEGQNFLAYEVMVKGSDAVRERVILNANTGAVLNHIDEIHSLLNRAIYTPTMDLPPVLTEGSPLAPADPPFQGDTKGNPASTRTADLPVNNLYVFAGGTYKLYKNLFGREGYDDGAIAAADQIQRSVYLVNDQCPNAYWDGTSTNYCPGFDADDVVSHEWSHAYTEYTHGLVYQYQSGALNESYSDIFGETYDLVNGIEGPLGVTLTEGTTYDQGGSRWVMGEDMSEVAAGILLRDMWDPDNFGVNIPILGISVLATPSPGSVITSPNYYCDTGDNGGVHTNSGVSNHAYAMLVDGKTFNGHTIPGIGLVKAAHIYFQAETHHQTPTTNYPQHADALEQSCAELIGQPLNDVFGNVSAEVITTADCSAVHEVTLAVEFRNTDAMTVAQKCDYMPVLQPEASTPAFCAAGLTETPTFKQTWEKVSEIPSDWTLSSTTTGDSTPSQFNWVISSALPAPHTGKAAFAVDNTGGTCASGGDISGSYSMDTPEISVPDDAGYFKFDHFMQAEAGYDGGNLKYSIDGAAFAVVPPAAFFYNQHSGAFSDAPLIEGVPDPLGLTGNNTNPLAGQAAWTGSDQGEATGSWGTTIVDLAKLGAVTGSKVKFRWEFGNDGCGGNVGWFVDDVKLGYCAAVDKTPDAFKFATKKAKAGTKLVSNVVTITGVSQAVSLSISGDPSAAYSKNDGAFTAADGKINNGDTLQLRLTVSASAPVEMQVKVGTYKTGYKVVVKP
ncbi:MAG: Thermolysin metallopeptidase [Hydrocarboniphaga sp.]|uniref:M4 family metallopeptidase n=1 Tax=Hydrocarboniphaga sp. TaxID=2033016 RepID=UPI00261A2767|nr:M4 family metallopeptidase [Hydrocarboniphaga sp.]MDB5968986.1 Thermolysin metallopeptidase [Hydrocarboniphaga sp.]